MQKYTLLEIQNGTPFYYDLRSHCGYLRFCSFVNFGRLIICFLLIPILIVCADLIPFEYHIPYGIFFILYPFGVSYFIGSKEDDEFQPCTADLSTLQKRYSYIIRHFIFQCVCLTITLPLLIYCIPAYLMVGSIMNLLGASFAILLTYELVINQRFFSKIVIIRRIKKGIQP